MQGIFLATSLTVCAMLSYFESSKKHEFRVLVVEYAITGKRV